MLWLFQIIMRKKIGGHRIRFFFFRNWARKLEFFLHAFVCVSMASPQMVHHYKPLQRKKKTVLQIVFENFLIHFSWHWERTKKVEVTVLIFAVRTKLSPTVLHTLSMTQTPQIRRSQTIRFSTRPLHPIHLQWRGLVNYELWTRPIASHFQSQQWFSGLWRLNCIKLPLKYCLSFFFTGVKFDLRTIHLLLVDRPELPWWKMGLWYSLPVFFVFNPLSIAKFTPKVAWAFAQVGRKQA